MHMATTNALSHDQYPADICVHYSVADESVGYSASGNEWQDLQIIHNLFMSDPHDAKTCQRALNHSCPIVSNKFTEIGIGIVYYQGGTWVTEIFLG
jgi:hypothetical protein